MKVEMLPVMLSFVFVLAGLTFAWSLVASGEAAQLRAALSSARSEVESERWRNEVFQKRLREAGLDTNIFEGNIIRIQPSIEPQSTEGPA